MTETNEQFLERWQHLHLQDKANVASPADRADTWRSMLAQADYARATNIVSHTAASSLWLTQADLYADVADSPEERNGLNNYAEGAMSLLGGKRNESQQWQSGLSEQLDCVAKFLEANKKAKETVIPEGKENAILQMSTSADRSTAPGPVPATYNGVTLVDQPAMAPTISSHPQNSSELSVCVPGNVHAPASSGNAWTAGQRANGTASFWKLGQHSAQTDQDGRDQETVANLYAAKPSPGVPSRVGLPGAFSKNPSATLFSSTSRYGRQPGEGQKRPREPSVEEDVEEDVPRHNPGSFRTAKEQLARDNQKKYSRGAGGGGEGYGGGGERSGYGVYGTGKKSLGTRRGPGSKFVPPVINRDDDVDDGGTLVRKAGGSKYSDTCPDEPVDDRLKNIEPKMVELIMSEIMDHGPPITWQDVAGLEFAKKTIKEIVVWPMLRPDIFTGLRGPPKGLLLFGPPGTGKTLIGKCIASQSKSTFFSISASSLTSKWVGEGEKMVRALFAVSRVHQPAVIFIDEIDSLLSQRSDGEHEASRRIKTEFLVQLDGATTGEDDRILVVGATNRPQEIDEAARRRFVKRLYIPLPEAEARRQIVVNLMAQQRHSLSEAELVAICDNTPGYSGADMANLCREAALGPIRSMSFGEIESITADQVRPIVYADFEAAFTQVRASVSEKDLDVYMDWNKQYGSWGIVTR